MPSSLCKVLLFLSSYFPLFAILALLVYSHSVLASVAIGTVGFLSWGGLELLLRYARKRINPETLKIESFRQNDAEVLSYIVSYLIPFMADFSKSGTELFALGVFFVVVGFLYVHSNLVHINPMLSARGYHLYELTLENGETCLFITRARLRKGATVSATLVGEHVYLQAVNS